MQTTESWFWLSKPREINKFYQNDSIKLELAPLRLEQGNHFSTTAEVQGALRPSSCWAHSGTGRSIETSRWNRRGIRRKQRLPSACSSSQLTAFFQKNSKAAALMTFVQLHDQSQQAFVVYDQCANTGFLTVPQTLDTQASALTFAAITSFNAFAQISLVQQGLFKTVTLPSLKTPHSFFSALLL